MLVVEAMEIVGDPDRIGRDPLRPTLRGCVREDGGELGETLDQLALLTLDRGRGAGILGVPSALRRMPAMRACAYWT